MPTSKCHQTQTSWCSPGRDATASRRELNTARRPRRHRRPSTGSPRVGRLDGRVEFKQDFWCLWVPANGPFSVKHRLPSRSRWECRLMRDPACREMNPPHVVLARHAYATCKCADEARNFVTPTDAPRRRDFAEAVCPCPRRFEWVRDARPKLPFDARRDAQAGPRTRTTSRRTIHAPSLSSTRRPDWRVSRQGHELPLAAHTRCLTGLGQCGPGAASTST